MFIILRKKGYLRLIRALLALLVLVNFSIPPLAQAQSIPLVSPQPLFPPAYTPTILKGLKVYPLNPLQFDFLVDTGDKSLSADHLQEEYQKLIEYFLVSLTLPEDELWVNLSPSEPDRIISQDLGKTQMGSDLLDEDYSLKKLTAQLLNPESAIGKELWAKIYDRMNKEFGTTDVPLDILNRVWIVPDKASVYVHDQSVFITESHLKVMMEDDYKKEHRSVTAAIVKDIILPEIEKEVNSGEDFARLRQIFHAMILATWYKKNLQKTIIGNSYVDQSKLKGLDASKPEVIQTLYQQYLQAFKKGAFNYLKEEYNSADQSVVVKKYISGGVRMKLAKIDAASLEESRGAYNFLTQNSGRKLTTLMTNLEPWTSDAASLAKEIVLKQNEESEMMDLNLIAGRKIEISFRNALTGGVGNNFIVALETGGFSISAMGKIGDQFGRQRMVLDSWETIAFGVDKDGDIGFISEDEQPARKYVEILRYEGTQFQIKNYLDDNDVRINYLPVDDVKETPVEKPTPQAPLVIDTILALHRSSIFNISNQPLSVDTENIGGIVSNKIHFQKEGDDIVVLFQASEEFPSRAENNIRRKKLKTGDRVFIQKGKAGASDVLQIYTPQELEKLKSLLGDTLALETYLEVERFSDDSIRVLQSKSDTLSPAVKAPDQVISRLVPESVSAPVVVQKDPKQDEILRAHAEAIAKGFQASEELPFEDLTGVKSVKPLKVLKPGREEDGQVVRQEDLIHIPLLAAVRSRVYVRDEASPVRRVEAIGINRSREVSDRYSLRIPNHNVRVLHSDLFYSGQRIGVGEVEPQSPQRLEAIALLMDGATGFRSSYYSLMGSYFLAMTPGGVRSWPMDVECNKLLISPRLVEKIGAGRLDQEFQDKRILYTGPKVKHLADLAEESVRNLKVGFRYRRPGPRQRGFVVRDIISLLQSGVDMGDIYIARGQEVEAWVDRYIKNLMEELEEKSVVQRGNVTFISDEDTSVPRLLYDDELLGNKKLDVILGATEGESLLTTAAWVKAIKGKMYVDFRLPGRLRMGETTMTKEQGEDFVKAEINPKPRHKGSSEDVFSKYIDDIFSEKDLIRADDFAIWAAATKYNIILDLPENYFDEDGNLISHSLEVDGKSGRTVVWEIIYTTPISAIKNRLMPKLDKFYQDKATAREWNDQDINDLIHMAETYGRYSYVDEAISYLSAAVDIVGQTSPSVRLEYVEAIREIFEGWRVLKKVDKTPLEGLGMHYEKAFAGIKVDNPLEEVARLQYGVGQVLAIIREELANMNRYWYDREYEEQLELEKRARRNRGWTPPYSPTVSSANIAGAYVSALKYDPENIRLLSKLREAELLDAIRDFQEWDKKYYGNDWPRDARIYLEKIYLKYNLGAFANSGAVWTNLVLFTVYQNASEEEKLKFSLKMRKVRDFLEMAPRSELLGVGIPKEVVDAVIDYRLNYSEGPVGKERARGAFRDLGRFFARGGNVNLLTSIEKELPDVHIEIRSELEEEKDIPPSLVLDIFDRQIAWLEAKTQIDFHQVQGIYHRLARAYYRKAVMLSNFGANIDLVRKYFAKAIKALKEMQGKVHGALPVQAQVSIVEIAATAGFSKADGHEYDLQEEFDRLLDPELLKGVMSMNGTLDVTTFEAKTYQTVMLNSTIKQISSAIFESMFGQRLLIGNSQVVEDIYQYFQSKGESSMVRQWFYKWLQEYPSEKQAQALARIGFNQPWVIPYLGDIIANRVSGDKFAAAKELMSIYMENKLGGLPVDETMEKAAETEVNNLLVQEGIDVLEVATGSEKASGSGVSFPIPGKQKWGNLILVANREAKDPLTGVDNTANGDNLLMGRVGDVFKGRDIDRIYQTDKTSGVSSPEQAFIRGAGLLKTGVQSSPQLGPRNFGLLAGWNPKDLKVFGPDVAERWLKSLDYQPPIGETMNDIIDRVGNYFVNNVMKDIAQGKNVVMIVDPFVLRAIVYILRQNTLKEAFDPKSEAVMNLDVLKGLPWFISFNPDGSHEEKTISKIEDISKAVSILPRADSAELTKDVGGIDLNSQHLDLNVQGEQDVDISIIVPDANFSKENIEGFKPIIFQIVPVTNLPLILGISKPSKLAEQLSLVP